MNSLNSTWILAAENNARIHNEELKFFLNQSCPEHTHWLSLFANSALPKGKLGIYDCLHFTDGEKRKSRVLNCPDLQSDSGLEIET